MKKIIFTFIVFALVANISAQLKINSSGKVGIGTAPNSSYQLNVSGSTHTVGDVLLGGSASNFVGTTTNSSIPIAFRLGSILAGFTGSSANSNVSFGHRALHSLAGWGNVAVGIGALVFNAGHSNTATGYQALYSNEGGYQNTAVGHVALYSNKEGINNVACGSHALHTNINGSYNTASGWGALRFNTSGEYNAATGFLALYSNTTGGWNTASGLSALASNTEGNFNTAIGCHALYLNTVGSQNTAVGSFADVTIPNLINATAIGYNAKATASNQVRIGNSSISSIILGNNATITSDGRTKRNIRAEVPGLAFIKQLQPVTYNFDLTALDALEKSDDPKINARRDSLLNARSSEEKAIEAKSRAKKEQIIYSGFIAQDVEKVAQSIGYDFSGVDAPEDGKGAYGLRYAEFVVPLVKAVQELSEQNERLIEAMKEQQDIMKEQQDIIEKLNQKVEKLENASVANLRSETEENKIVDLSDAVVKQCKLYQNAPNPFNQSTQIKYYLPQEVKTAYLCIYNLQGMQIKQILIPERGEGVQWILGSELSAGMYLYALIVDGKEVDTKRMILTK